MSDAVTFADANFVDAPDRAGFTPLLRAILARPWRPETIEQLLKAGADPNGAATDGNTALHCAIDVAPRRGKGEERILRMLLRAGASLNRRQCHGWTPLLCAILRGRVAAARLLLEAGADPDECMPREAVPAFNAGRTALMVALTSRNADQLLQALLDAGANPDAVDLHGMTFFEYAAVLADGPRPALRMYARRSLGIVRRRTARPVA